MMSEEKLLDKLLEKRRKIEEEIREARAEKQKKASI